MKKYRKRPVVIEAVQFTGEDRAELETWMGNQSFNWFFDGHEWASFNIATLEGVMEASKGDWIIKGVQGEFYPCRNDIFEQTYEAVTE